MKAKIGIGKITDYEYKGSRNQANIEIRLEWKESCAPHQTINHEPIAGYWEFAASGEVWQHNKRDILLGGQCLEEIFEHFPTDPTLQKIVPLWRKWHLNGMRPGCAHQKTGNYDDPKISNQVCPISAYKYGHAWLVAPLPDPILAKLKDIFGAQWNDKERTAA